MKLLKYLGVMAGVMMFMFTFVSCEKTDEDKAKETYENYAKALENMNYEKAANFLCKDGQPLSEEEAKDKASSMKLFYPISGVKCEIVNFEYDDTSKEANVTFSMKSKDGDAETQKFVKVIQCEDKWYIEEQ